MVGFLALARIALVGPSGAGKTTAAAKLAAHFSGRDKRVALVSTDTDRVGSLEQIRAYGGILDLPVDLAYTPDEMREAMRNRRDADLIIVATVTAEMTCPSTACRVSQALGAAPAAAFDLVAACSGFVYSINIADPLVRSGIYRTIGVVGCDAMTTVVDFGERTVSVLFGDAAGAVVLQRDDDPERGCFYQKSQADGRMWGSLYMPRRSQDIPDHDRDNPVKLGCLRMNGREIYKFAITKFREVIQDALNATGLSTDDISQFVCHQSNVRIIESSIEKLGLPAEKVYINIDRYGNSSAGSVGLCLDQLWRAGKINRGDNVMFVAFGGGLTWSTSIWRV